MIYRYVFSKRRSIRPLEINQYITMTTHYDITMVNDVDGDAHFEITMCNVVASDIHYDVTMNNDVAMCTYHGITMHNDITTNLFYYVFSAQCLIMILLWVVWNKTRSCLISLVWRTHSLFLGEAPYVFSPDWSDTHLFLLYNTMVHNTISPVE